MARTYTNTQTRTYTRARTHLIRVQFKSFATRFGYPARFVDALADGVSDRLVAGLAVYGVNNSGQTLASVELRIDWTANDELSETTEVTIDSRWAGDVSPQLVVFEEAFEEFIAEQALTLDLRVELSPDVVADTTRYQLAMTRLHLQPGKPISWKGKTIAERERLRGLAEMSTGVEFVDE